MKEEKNKRDEKSWQKFKKKNDKKKSEVQTSLAKIILTFPNTEGQRVDRPKHCYNKKSNK